MRVLRQCGSVRLIQTDHNGYSIGDGLFYEKLTDAAEAYWQTVSPQKQKVANAVAQKKLAASVMERAHARQTGPRHV